MECNRMEDGKHLPQRGAWLIPKDQPSADRRGRDFFEGISRRTESWGCFPSSMCTALCPIPKPSEGGLKITACQRCLPKGGDVLSLLAWCLSIGRCSQSQPLCHWDTCPVWDLAQGKKCRTYSWDRRTWGELLEACVNIQLGMVCPNQVTAGLSSHLLQKGRRTKATCPSLGTSTFQIRLELEVKRKGLNWMRDLTTVWSSLHLNILTRDLNILTRLLDAAAAAAGCCCCCRMQTTGC